MTDTQYTPAEQELFKSYTHINLCKKYYSKDYCYKSIINNINYYDDWFSHFDSYVVPQLKNFIHKYQPIIKSGKTKKQLIMNIFHWWFGVHPSNYPEVWNKYF